MTNLTKILIGPALACLSAATASADPITIVVDGFRNDKGVISFSICREDEYDSAMNDQAACDISHHAAVTLPTTTVVIDIPAGQYAGLFLHDENENGDADFLGPLPTEGIGLSNNPILLFGAPSFDKVRKDVNGPATWEMKVNYLL